MEVSEITSLCILIFCFSLYSQRLLFYFPTFPKPDNNTETMLIPTLAYELKLLIN